MDLCNRNDIQALLQRHGFRFSKAMGQNFLIPFSYTHLRAHETPEHLVCRLLLEKKLKIVDYILHFLLYWSSFSVDIC